MSMADNLLSTTTMQSATITANVTTDIIKPTKDFTYVACTYLSGTVFLCFLMSGPLLKLAKTRPAVHIINSKCVATILDLPISVAGMLNGDFFYVQIPLTIAIRIHLLGLALNRAYSVLFPFHYCQQDVNKKKMYTTCLLLWIISMLIGVGSLAFGQFMLDNTAIAFGQIVKRYTNLAVAATSATIYACLAMKLIWTRKMRSNNGSASSAAYSSIEKDHIRLFFVCMIGVLPFLGSYMQKYEMPFFPVWLQNVLNIVGAICDSLSFVMEELCLICICADLRALIRQHCRRIVALFVPGIKADLLKQRQGGSKNGERTMGKREGETWPSTHWQRQQQRRCTTNALVVPMPRPSMVMAMSPMGPEANYGVDFNSSRSARTSNC